MATKTIQQILKSHQDLVKRVGEHMETATKGRKMSTEFVLREQDSVVGRLKGRVAGLKKARAEAIKRFDVEIRVNETRIAELEKRIKDGREALKTKPKKPTKPKKKPTDKIVVKRKVNVKKKVKPTNKVILKQKTKPKKKVVKKK
ncbi:MAG: hypothetical protein GY791_12730 [Alphaproteobacteria bacterium]|nr:hypothetical protein [Alphaproteobacteria bacterium]